jgi:hypothetical protein
VKSKGSDLKIAEDLQAGLTPLTKSFPRTNPTSRPTNAKSQQMANRSPRIRKTSRPIKRRLPSINPTLLEILEDVVVGWHRKESFQQSIADLGGRTWNGVLTLLLLVFVLLIPFVGFEELGRVFGEGKLQKLHEKDLPGLLQRQLHGRVAIQISNAVQVVIDVCRARKGLQLVAVFVQE